jgi:predicted dehydrogenase
MKPDSPATCPRRTFLRTAGAGTIAALAAPAFAQQQKPKLNPDTGKGKIRIGQIGTGHSHASGKMKVYRQSPDFEVVGIVEPDQKLRSAAENNATYKDLHWMTAEQLFNTPGLNAIAVETEVKHLLPTAETCIAAGVHIHLDKPPGDDLGRFERLLDDATRKHLTVQLGYMYRFNPAVVLMRDLLKKGWLGVPFEAHAVMSKVISPSGRGQLTQFPGGIMFELGCHIVDLLVQALGKPAKVSAYPRHSSPEIDDNWRDNMLAVCEYPGATATLRSSAIEVEGNARRHFTLCGSEGTIHIQPLDRPAVKLALSKPREKYVKGYQTIEFEPYERYVGDAADFAKIIRGVKASDFTPQHDLAVQETLLRAAALMGK